jgi:hypothetical protein
MSVNIINGTRTVRWDKDLVKIHSKRRIATGNVLTLVKSFSEIVLIVPPGATSIWISQSFGKRLC